MAYQYLFGTYKDADRERRIVRVKAQEVPELSEDVFYTAEEVSDDMYVSHEFRVGECFKRDEDMEGNFYAWYYVTEYSRTMDKSPGMKAEIERLNAENAALAEANAALEDTICELDSSTDERITNNEDSICELDILVNELIEGGNA